jgi:hypothetical protein
VRTCAEFETPFELARNLKPSCAPIINITKSFLNAVSMDSADSFADFISDTIGDLADIYNRLPVNPRDDLANLQALGRRALQKIVSSALCLRSC